MILDKDKIQKINLFENLTNSKIKDFIDDEKIIIIAEQGEMAKTLGRKGQNIKRIEKIIHKRVKAVEFNKDPLIFIKNFIYPLKADEVNLNNNVIEITSKDRKTKGLLIGRNGRNLAELNNLIKSYYNLSIKII